MFAVIKTGGKQYKVAEGDEIVIEKLAADAGDAQEDLLPRKRGVPDADEHAYPDDRHVGHAVVPELN